MQIWEAILAEKIDLFDMLAYVAYAADPRPAPNARMPGPGRSNGNTTIKPASLLNDVLGHHVDTGVEDLDLRLRYGAYAQGAEALRGVERTVDSFFRFKKHLYSSIIHKRLCAARPQTPCGGPEWFARFDALLHGSDSKPPRVQPTIRE